MPARLTVVRRSSVLPIPAATARELAARPALFEHVVAPVLRVRGLDVPAPLRAGAVISGRLWWFGVVPAWRHHIRLVQLTPGEIRTNERGGPVRTWNHRLTFEALDAGRCRYTDEIELDGGLAGLPTRLFARALFRHRHRRWRALARVLAA